MRKYLLTGLAALGCASGAQAAPTIIYTPGSFAIPGFTTAQIFENFNGGVQADASPFVQSADATARGYVETATGNALTYTGTVPGDAVDPQPGELGKYLSVRAGSNFTVDFGAGDAGVSFFSFIFGSLDAYNSLTLNFAGGAPSITYTGIQILGLAAPGSGVVGERNSTTNGRVSFDTGAGAQITSAVFTSAEDAFEIDSLAAAVPEPGTWAMMILGFGLIGSQLRSRKRRTTVSFA